MEQDPATHFRTEYLWDRATRIERWGEGPWLDEPDVCEWNFYSIRCFMRRHPEIGSWAGYVGLQRGHPWYGLDDDDIPASAHRGLSWVSDNLSFDDVTELGAAFFPSPTEQPLWWVGFHTGHGDDLPPHAAKLLPSPMGAVYRHFRYVREQVNLLAKQALAAIRALD